MPGKQPSDPISKITENLNRLQSECSEFERRLTESRANEGYLTDSVAVDLLSGVLRLHRQPDPRRTACELMEHFGSLSEVLEAPVALLRQAGVKSEAAISGIVVHRLLREAIAGEKFRATDASINSSNLEPFLLKSRRPHDKTLTTLFLGSAGILLHQSNSKWASHQITPLVRLICQTALHQDASGVVVALYTLQPRFSVEDSLFRFTDKLSAALAHIDATLHDVVIVGQASVHSLSELNSL